jgi:protein-disulfide isomerase
MMAPDETRVTTRSDSQGGKLGDVALVGTLVGVLIVLTVSFINQKELRRLSARVTQLETVTTAAAAQGAGINKLYDVEVAAAPAKGPLTATITIAEFSDFQCPFCFRVNPTIKQLEDKYKDKVRLVWKHLPLISIHPHAMDAAVAAEAARNQGKFWEFHDMLFANQDKLERDDVRRYAQQLGLDVAQFDKDRDDPALKTKVLDDMAEATALGVKSTPTFFINGRLVRGAMPIETFSTIIDEELARQNAPHVSSN